MVSVMSVMPRTSSARTFTAFSSASAASTTSRSDGLPLGRAAFLPGEDFDFARTAAVLATIAAVAVVADLAFVPVFALALGFGLGISLSVVRRVAGRFAVMLTSWLWD